MPNPSGSSSGSKRVLIIGTILVVLIIAILLALFFRPSGVKLPTTPTPKPTTTTTTPPPPPVAQTPPAAPSGQVVVQSVARLFAERYGSYSTEANFANLRDVLPLMTDALATKTNATIQTAKTPALFYGVTTRAVAVKLSAFDERAGTATATVSTQRQETMGTAAPTVKYQDLALTFERVGSEWKVSSATWK